MGRQPYYQTDPPSIHTDAAETSLDLRPMNRIEEVLDIIIDDILLLNMRAGIRFNRLTSYPAMCVCRKRNSVIEDVPQQHFLHELQVTVGY